MKARFGFAWNGYYVVSLKGKTGKFTKDPKRAKTWSKLPAALDWLRPRRGDWGEFTPVEMP